MPVPDSMRCRFGPYSGKARRHVMPHASIHRRTWELSRPRLFRTAVPGLVEMDGHGFRREAPMQKLIEDNIGTLFPGLKFLESEFRGMAEGEFRPDTVAFDKSQNTFVAIEYKNKLNSEAVDQAKAYLRTMKQHKDSLVLLHSRNMECNPLPRESFHWKEMYAIIMAPEFGKYQSTAFDDDATIEMYEISLYDDNVLLVQRVGGGHKGRPPNKPERGTGGEQGHDGGKPAMDHLYEIIRQRLLDAFPGANVHKTKYYFGFRRPGGKYFCVLEIHTSKIWLYYSGIHDNIASEPPDFVVNAHRLSKWRSAIRNEADFNRALAILLGTKAGGTG